MNFSSGFDVPSNSNDFNESTEFDNSDTSTGLTSESGIIETEFGNGKFPTNGHSLMKFGGGRPPPVDFNEPSIGVFGSGDQKKPEEQFSSTDDPNGLSKIAEVSKTIENLTTEDPKTTEKIVGTASSIETTLLTTSSESVERVGTLPPAQPILKNSGLLPALPPSDFFGEFGTGRGRIPMRNTLDEASVAESIFTGDSALVPNRLGPSGDGLGPPIPSGAAIPPPGPAVGIGGSAAGILPTLPDHFLKTQTPATTIKPSALLSFLTKADVGFNQALNHFEHGTPAESAAIDILEVNLV
ncbi:unnamed protein product [Onchocerca flexuosa]|uniref:UBA domain-containing protein n=1 Tax=Onchocerca flexuosa TaxID=387005 RepID=A0A183HI64_9BILA|nr:unnamed protein product [Onchocerca flexuosa]